MQSWGKLEPYLEDLECRIDEVQEQRLLDETRRFADGDSSTAPFTPIPRVPAPPCIDWPRIPINEALRDETAMILRELWLCSEILAAGGTAMMNIRPNYGVGILPSAFGAKPYIMPPETDTLPNVLPWQDPEEEVRRLLESPEPSFDAGWGEHVFHVGKMFRRIREQYPRIRRYVRLDHPDCKGPMDICELLWGSGIFLEFYDHEELLHTLLQRITDFYIRYIELWFDVAGKQDDYNAYFGRLHRGRITLRCDSAMNLSPEIYDAFIYPYDSRILAHFGGGMIHFCGRGDHFVPRMARMPYLYAVDVSQPHLNNLEILLENTVDRGINLLTRGNLIREADLCATETHALHRVML